MKNSLLGRLLIIGNLLVVNTWATQVINSDNNATTSKDSIINPDKKKNKTPRVAKNYVFPKYILPEPETMYLAFNKVKPNVPWEKYLTNNTNISYESNPQIAYNIGLQLSNSFLLFTRKKLDTNNIMMMKTLTRKLGVEEKIIRRISSIEEALKKGKKGVVIQELTYMNDEIVKALSNNSRVDLSAVVRVGAWIGAIYSTTNLLHTDYNKKAASFLAQKDVIIALSKSLENRESLVFDTITQEVLRSLKEIEVIIGNKKELTKTEIEKIYYIISRVVIAIEKA